MAEVKRGNPKAFQQIDVRIKDMQKTQGKVGWFESAKYPDGTPVAYVAAIQEIGHGKIPSRSFMRSTAIEEKINWSEIIKKGAKLIVNGKLNPRAFMEMLTLKAQGDVSKKISSIYSPPLSPITIAARKYRKEGKKVTGKTIGEIAKKLKNGDIDLSGVSTKPLEDSGLMSATLTSTVESNAS